MSDSWYQQALRPPAVFELNVRLGLIPEEDHAQALVELKDPISGALLGQWSAPHETLRGYPQLLHWAVSQAVQAVDELLDTF